MAEVVETRRVIIEYENRITGDLGPMEGRTQQTTVTPELVDAIRRELIRTGSRNPDIFGGRA